MSQQTKISATIITLNEERCIRECIESLEFADEVIVIDSGSKDKTIDICLELGAKVIQQEWLGFGAQKQLAVDQTQNDWVFCIDADERVSRQLNAEITELKQQAEISPKAFNMSRCNRFLGRWLRHGEGYPDHNLRLFHKQYARWSEHTVHEHVITDEKVGLFKSDLMHESEDGIFDYLQKQNRYTTLQAEALLAKGKKGSIARMLISPVTRFIKFYFIRRGFQDGVPGLIHVLIGCVNSMTKYAKLIELNIKAEKDS
ncbi:MAG: glycosyltransferase family 2 protein [Gammaproteobacteria bacterium]|nr:MAG: glycosyltransferase family 2 protein [Gammaproteobacteria bacterium]